jgi:hypothetical protein
MTRRFLPLPAHFTLPTSTSSHLIHHGLHSHWCLCSSRFGHSSRGCTRTCWSSRCFVQCLVRCQTQLLCAGDRQQCCGNDTSRSCIRHSGQQRLSFHCSLRQRSTMGIIYRCVHMAASVSKFQASLNSSCSSGTSQKWPDRSLWFPSGMPTEHDGPI